MKFKYSAFMALIAASSVQASDIVITGVIDGPLPGGVPKGVELFLLILQVFLMLTFPIYLTLF